MLPRLAQLEDILEKTDKIMSKQKRKNSLHKVRVLIQYYVDTNLRFSKGNSLTLASWHAYH